MNQDEYILKTITGERDDLLEINEQLKFERKNLKQQLSQKDEMIKILEKELRGISSYCENLEHNQRFTIKNTADQALSRLNEMRKEQA